MNGSAPCATRLANTIERQQTAACGAVVAGAEGERRLDLDADPVRRDPRAVVGAVHDKAAGGDRLEPGEALLDPIGRGVAAEAQHRGGDAGALGEFAPCLGIDCASDI